MYGFFEAGCVFKPMHAVCSRVFSQGCNTNQTGTQIIKFCAYTLSSLIERVYTLNVYPHDLEMFLEGANSGKDEQEF